MIDIGELRAINARVKSGSEDPFFYCPFWDDLERLVLAVSELLNEIERLREENDRLRAEISEYVDCQPPI